MSVVHGLPEKLKVTKTSHELKAIVKLRQQGCDVILGPDSHAEITATSNGIIGIDID